MNPRPKSREAGTETRRTEPRLLVTRLRCGRATGHGRQRFAARTGPELRNAGTNSALLTRPECDGRPAGCPCLSASPLTCRNVCPPAAHVTGESSPQFQHVNQSANRGARFNSWQVAHGIERTSAGVTGRGQLQAAQRHTIACRPGASRSIPALRHSVCPQRGQVKSAMRKHPVGWPDMPVRGSQGDRRPVAAPASVVQGLPADGSPGPETTGVGSTRHRLAREASTCLGWPETVDIKGRTRPVITLARKGNRRVGERGRDSV